MSLRLSENVVLSVEAARRVFAFLAIRGAAVNALMNDPKN